MGTTSPLRQNSGIAPEHARIAGCLYGGAVGDGFGYAVEFLSISDIRARHGDAGLLWPVYNESGELEVSDDTQMTLYTAAGLLRACENGNLFDFEAVLDAVREATLDWHARQRHGERNADCYLSECDALDRVQAPGNTCIGGCEAGATGTFDAPLNVSAGCGGVMRTAPVGLVPGLDADDVFHIAARCAVQTHGSPSAYVPAGVMAATVNEVVAGLPLMDSVEQAISIAKKWRGSEPTVRAYRIARTLACAKVPNEDHAQAIAEIGEGWEGHEAFAMGLYAALSGSDYTQTVRIASNHGGDSDSTASIAGQLYGVSRGVGTVPGGWIRKLDTLRALEETVLRLSKLWGAERENRLTAPRHPRPRP